MATILVLHGAYGSPRENWFPWLETELSRAGHRVLIPHFPTPDGQDLVAWLAVLDLFADHLGPSTVLVGHSIGAAFALRALEVRDIRVRGVVLVAGFLSPLGDKRFDPLNASFLDPPWDFPRIRSRVGRLLALASGNDPYVPPAKTTELRECLGCDVVEIADAGHFNTDSGYSTFPRLLEAVEDMIHDPFPADRSGA